ncbi:hypothetical protein D3C85_790840 [compost metagenome]
MTLGQFGEALGGIGQLAQQFLPEAVLGIAGPGIVGRRGQQDMPDPQPGRLGKALPVRLEEAPAGRLVRFRHPQFALQQHGHGLVVLLALGVHHRRQTEHGGALAEQLAHHQGAGGLQLGFGQGARRVERRFPGDGGFAEFHRAHADHRGWCVLQILDCDQLHGTTS